MNKGQRFIALRVHHPRLPPSEIAERLKMDADVSWQAGAPRTTPKGRPLQGINEETYCHFPLSHDHSQLAGGIEELFELLLEPSRAVFLEIAASGGRIELYVSWETSSNVGDLFSLELLQKFIDLRLALATEWFPQED